jgi:hypothetical protein
MNASSDSALTAEERKRKRLEAWRRRQEEQAPKKVSVSLSLKAISKKPKKKPVSSASVKPPNPFFNDEESGSEDEEEMESGRRKRPLDLMEDLTGDKPVPSKRAKSSGSRWDNPHQALNTDTNSEETPTSQSRDLLDEFMEKLEAGASGTVTAGSTKETLSIHVGSSMMRGSRIKSQLSPISGSVITAEDLQKLHQTGFKKNSNSASKTNVGGDVQSDQEAFYHPKDWLSDVPSDTDDENEEDGRRALIEALKSAPVPGDAGEETEDSFLSGPVQTAAELKTEKSRREERLRQLEDEAVQARRSAQAAEAPELGRLYEEESGIMEEAERNLQAAKAAPDALTVLAELNKKKELKAVDHSMVEYMPFQKNLYRVPRSMANLTNNEVINRRAKLKIRVRGHGAPAPVSTFAECGLSEKILQILESQKITEPFPVQAQCIPCIMGKCNASCTNVCLSFERNS